ncbi:MAG: AlpA family transcriptional regulator [Novosphingobium sp.]
MQILRRPEVERRTGLARSTIYAAMAAGKFPAPIKLSARSVGWLESDVREWLEARVAASAPQA